MKIFFFGIKNCKMCSEALALLEKARKKYLEISLQQFDLERERDMARAQEFSINAHPAIVIENELFSQGRIPSADELEGEIEKKRVGRRRWWSFSGISKPLGKQM